MFRELLQNVRELSPVIHCITNYVTVNDCANLLLAAGASPIMADDPEEAAEITALCSGLTLNLGTLSSRTIPAMLTAGWRAAELGRPVVLDPVGVGASRLRTDTAAALLEAVPFAAVRGNMSEMKVLASGAGATRGVDVQLADRVTEDSLGDAVAFAKRLADRTGGVVAITGAIDVVADGARAFCIRNGHPMMSRVTGTGCMLSALTAAFLAANPGRPLEAAAGAAAVLGLCGEIAHARLGPQDGNASYRNYLIDAVYNLAPEALETGANYDLR